jgi:phthiocerol/phenolphthiocerol synthesis type-I polyketide synthase C
VTPSSSPFSKLPWKRETSFHKRLDLDYAFHSAAMDGIEVELKAVLAEPPRDSAAKVNPFYSTVSGKRLAWPQLDAEYWWQNIRQPVLFESAINAILDDGANIFIEIGPNPILRSYLNDCLKERAIEGRVIGTLRPCRRLATSVWGAASQAIIAGANPDWQQFFPQPGRFVQLPSYPWQRERHWHPVTAASAGLIYRRKLHPLLGYPLPQHELTWENELDTQLYPVLADHVVGEATFSRVPLSPRWPLWRPLRPGIQTRSQPSKISKSVRRCCSATSARQASARRSIRTTAA